MIFSPPPRRLRPELLDIDESPYEEVRESLVDVRRVNTYLSGYRVLLHHIEPFLRGHTENRPFTILDLATGSADQPLAVVDLSRSIRIPIRVVAIDINAKMLRLALEETRACPEINLLQGDIFSVPFKDNSFDLVINSLSLHHFSEANAVKILQMAYRISRKGFIVNDLHRSRVAYAAIILLTRLFTRNRLTRYDAPVSVMNAFTPTEMREMALMAGIGTFAVHRHFPYRIALVAKKQAHASA